MGWAAGVERIMLSGEAQPTVAAAVQLFIALDDDAARRTAFELLGEARSAGLTAQMELGGRSLKGQLGHAGALGARYVAIVAAGGEAHLKDMQSGEQESATANTVVHAVLRGLHEV
jgi:histidyl-tRNA synthetase